MFGHHPCLPIGLVFNLQSPAESITYPCYIDNWQSAMRQTYDIAALKSKARGERVKAYYDHKVHSLVLHPGDRVLIKNLSEHGGPGKLRSFWEEKIYLIVKQKAPDSPVYELEPESGEGHNRTLHRNLLFPCGDLFPSEPKVDAKPKHMRRSKGKARKYNVRRQQLKQQAQDESSSESSDEDHGVTFLMPSQLPSVPKNDVVLTPANEVSLLPASVPTLIQGEIVPTPPDNFGNPSQSQSVPPQDTVVANEMQGDLGHSAPASSETNETTQPAQDTSEVPVPSVTESDTVEGVANTEQAQEEELPQESLCPQQTRQPPSRLSYYLPGSPVYCEHVSSNQPPSEMKGFGNHVWSNPYSNNRYPVSQNIQQINMDDMHNGYGANWQFNYGHHHYDILPYHPTSFSHNSRSMVYPFEMVPSFWQIPPPLIIGSSVVPGLLIPQQNSVMYW